VFDKQFARPGMGKPGTTPGQLYAIGHLGLLSQRDAEHRTDAEDQLAERCEIETDVTLASPRTTNVSSAS